MSLKLLYLVRSDGHEFDAMVTKAGESAAIFFLVLSSFAANVVAPTTSELEEMYSAAAQELDAGHYREALQKLDAIDARQPDMAAAQNLRGVAWMRLAEYRKAETALRKAREIDPDFWEARFNLAEVPFLTQDWTEARRRFTALAAEPNDHLDGATSDLIQFKILLTFLLEGKEKMGAPVLTSCSWALASSRERFQARCSSSF
jgi:predicted Zn-dependent protease